MEIRVRKITKGGHEKVTESNQEGKSFREGPVGARSKQRLGVGQSLTLCHSYSPGCDCHVVLFLWVYKTYFSTNNQLFH